ncbi:MAG TPA: RES family NAD+ phosphorylase [Opitutaceae bacterium]|jgi:RES domain-containing protein
MIAWRLCNAKRSATALTGEGAAKFPGRWNSTGRSVVYMSESRSLAALEVLAHTEDTSLLGAVKWVAIQVEFDGGLVSEVRRLPPNWSELPSPASTRAVGDEWIEKRRSLVLRVPSVVTAGEFNLLLNPRHPDLAKARIGSPQAFRFDSRIG